MESEKEFVSIAEAARRIGITESTLRKAIEVGRVDMNHRDAKGKMMLDWEVANYQYTASAQSHAGRKKREQLIAAKAESPPVVAKIPDAWASMLPSANTKMPVKLPEPETERDPNQQQTYAESRADTELYKSRLAKLEFEEKSGMLINVEVLRTELFKINRKIRDSLVTLPDRLAPQLAVMNEASEVHLTLATEINEALRALAEDLYPGVGALIEK